MKKTSLTARARDQSDTSSSFPLNKRANGGKNTKTGDFPWDHAEKKKLFFPLPGEKGILLGKGACVENNPVWLWVIVFAAGVNSRLAVGHTQKYRPISEEGKVFFPGKKRYERWDTCLRFPYLRCNFLHIISFVFSPLSGMCQNMVSLRTTIFSLFMYDWCRASNAEEDFRIFFCCGKQLAILFPREKKGGGGGTRGLLSVKLLSPLSHFQPGGEKRNSKFSSSLFPHLTPFP